MKCVVMYCEMLMSVISLVSLKCSILFDSPHLNWHYTSTFSAVLKQGRKDNNLKFKTHLLTFLIHVPMYPVRVQIPIPVLHVFHVQY